MFTLLQLQYSVMNRSDFKNRHLFSQNRQTKMPLYENLKKKQCLAAKTLFKKLGNFQKKLRKVRILEKKVLTHIKNANVGLKSTI